jgi:hypothetical protein
MRALALIALCAMLIAWALPLPAQSGRDPRQGGGSRPAPTPEAPQNPRFPANQLLPQRQPPAQTHQEAYRQIFTRVEEGLSSGDIRAFSDHMAPQLYINLRGGESGYYSASQAYYVLESYLKSRKLVKLNFTTIGESEARPYATGSAGFVTRGSRELAQVYVSLTQSGERWTITQINIY